MLNTPKTIKDNEKTDGKRWYAKKHHQIMNFIDSGCILGSPGEPRLDKKDEKNKAKNCHGKATSSEASMRSPLPLEPIGDILGPVRG